MALELAGSAMVTPLDSRFFSDSFLVRLSLDMAGTSSSDWVVLAGFGSGLGFNGEETAGTWSSSSARFWGSEEAVLVVGGFGFELGVGSRRGDSASDAMAVVYGTIRRSECDKGVLCLKIV